MWPRPTLTGILQARLRIAPYIHWTPLEHHRSLDALLGAEVHVKHENHQRLGAFKMRGGLNLIGQLSGRDRQRGVITASTGNHGQSIAFAAGVYGVPATIVVPRQANPGKVEAIRQLGAKVVFHGHDFDDARQHVERLSRAEGTRYIHSANEPALIEGVGTCAWEIVSDLPDVEVIIVPVGGGSGACGACVVAKSVNPKIEVIGVQAQAADAAYRSWKTGRLTTGQMTTVAEGLATRVGFELTQQIMRDLMDAFILVSEDELKEAVLLHLQKTHNLAEHAGAAPLAAAMKIKDRLAGKKIALILSGGNLSMEHLQSLLADGGHPFAPVA